MKTFNKILFLLGGLILLATISPASADHSWGIFHWARTANPFTLKIGDNVSSAWDVYLGTTANDWSQSSILDLNIVPGGTNLKNCKPVSGTVQVCSGKYGFNGWLGIASIWVSGNHITQGHVKLNDSYFNTRTYNKPAWRNLVMCQEVGHTLGLDHQDENMNNTPLGTCMDYSSDPNPNQHPNDHDYAMLEEIYTHLDDFTTLSSSVAPNSSSARPGFSSFEPGEQAEWGKAIRESLSGQPILFERDLGHGKKVFTFVIWAE